MTDYFGKETPKLGFGLMRLPQKGAKTDIEQVKKMVDMFLGAGFTYFDTAFVYGTSEEDIREALVGLSERGSLQYAYAVRTKNNKPF